MNKELARKGSRETEATPSAVLLALADRCERDFGHVMLNIAIAKAIGWYSVQFGSVVWRDPHHHDHVTVPDFTTSLDSAVTLVPEGWVVSDLCQTYETARDWHVALWQIGAVESQVYGDAKTEPMARCAAALRARAAVAEGSVSPERSEAVP